MSHPTEHAKELNPYRLRLVIRGALDYFGNDLGPIVEILENQGQYQLVQSLNTTESALLWLRRMVEDAITYQEKQNA